MNDFQMKFQNSIDMVAQKMYNAILISFFGVRTLKCWAISWDTSVVFGQLEIILRVGIK